MPKVYNKRNGDAPPSAVYVGRPSKWGNPFTISSVHDRATVISLFEEHVLPKLDLEPLRGKDLVCWCAPLPCHADSLLREANK